MCELHWDVLMESAVLQTRAVGGILPSEAESDDQKTETVFIVSE
jgi:hypothetical protein